MHCAHSSVKCNTVTNVGKKLHREFYSLVFCAVAHSSVKCNTATNVGKKLHREFYSLVFLLINLSISFAIFWSVIWA